MSPPIGPPRWVSSLLARVLPSGTIGTSVKADLDQEFREMLGRVTSGTARRWYAWEALKLAAHYSWGGVRSLDLPRSGGRGIWRASWGMFGLRCVTSDGRRDSRS